MCAKVGERKEGMMTAPIVGFVALTFFFPARPLELLDSPHKNSLNAALSPSNTNQKTTMRAQ